MKPSNHKKTVTEEVKKSENKLKMAIVRPYLPPITLNVNALNLPNKIAEYVKTP
jgi:hypothetical protein